MKGIRKVESIHKINWSKRGQYFYKKQNKRVYKVKTLEYNNNCKEEYLIDTLA